MLSRDITLSFPCSMPFFICKLSFRDCSKDAAGQQCCYDREGYLMMTTDTQWGGNPHRAHDFGMIPYYEANKVDGFSFCSIPSGGVWKIPSRFSGNNDFIVRQVPTLSHYYHDIVPFYFCCMWQHEQSEGCTTYRFERRISQDCVGYQPPGSGLFASSSCRNPFERSHVAVRYRFDLSCRIR